MEGFLYSMLNGYPSVPHFPGFWWRHAFMRQHRILEIDDEILSFYRIILSFAMSHRQASMTVLVMNLLA